MNNKERCHKTNFLRRRIEKHRMERINMPNKTLSNKEMVLNKRTKNQHKRKIKIIKRKNENK